MSTEVADDHEKMECDGDNNGTTTGPSFQLSDMIDVLVGPTKQRFRVHTTILTAKSTFFKAACSYRWRAAPSPIKLPEDDPHIFDYYLYCMYTGVIQMLDDPEQSYSRLVRTYILADKLGDVVTANKIIDAIIDRSDADYVIPLGMEIVFENTVTGSLLRRLYVDCYAHEGGEPALQDVVHSGEVSKELMGEVLMEICKIVRKYSRGQDTKGLGDGFTSRHKCRYHQHDSTHPYCGETCEMTPVDGGKEEA